MLYNGSERATVRRGVVGFFYVLLHRFHTPCVQFQVLLATGGDCWTKGCKWEALQFSSFEINIIPSSGRAGGSHCKVCGDEQSVAVWLTQTGSVFGRWGEWGPVCRSHAVAILVKYEFARNFERPPSHPALLDSVTLTGGGRDQWQVSAHRPDSAQLRRDTQQWSREPSIAHAILNACESWSKFFFSVHLFCQGFWFCWRKFKLLKKQFCVACNTTFSTLAQTWVQKKKNEKRWKTFLSKSRNSANEFLEGLNKWYILPKKVVNLSCSNEHDWKAHQERRWNNNGDRTKQFHKKRWTNEKGSFI